MPTFRKPLLIQNPTAGKAWSSGVNGALQARLMDWLPDLRIQRTKGPGHAIELTREASRGGSELVIASGGDGTVNEVINGLAGTETVLSYLPMGTGNTMARELGLPSNPATIIDALRRGEVREASLGIADGRFFGLMIGFGFDGDAVRRVPYRLKRIFGRLSYAWAGAMTLLRYPLPRFSVLADGRSLEATTLVVAKSKYYASRFSIVPEVSMKEPYFELCVFSGRGWIRYLGYIGGVLLNRHTRFKGVRIIKARKVEIQSVAGVMAQMDGEPLLRVPAVVQIAEEHIKVLYPR